MKKREKWTVRGVDMEVVEILRQVSVDLEMPIGELLSEAVLFWHDGLRSEEEVDRIREMLADLQTQSARMSDQIATLAGSVPK